MTRIPSHTISRASYCDGCGRYPLTVARWDIFGQTAALCRHCAQHAVNALMLAEVQDGSADLDGRE